MAQSAEEFSTKGKTLALNLESDKYQLCGDFLIKSFITLP